MAVSFVRSCQGEEEDRWATQANVMDVGLRLCKHPTGTQAFSLQEAKIEIKPINTP